MTIPILLLHGLIGDLSVPEIVRHFGDRPVYAPAMLGYGEFRDHPTGGLTLDDQVEHVANWRPLAGGLGRAGLAAGTGRQ